MRLHRSFKQLAQLSVAAILALTLTACGGTVAVAPTTPEATTVIQATTPPLPTATTLPPTAVPTVMPTVVPTTLPTATTVPATATSLPSTVESATEPAGQATGQAGDPCSILTIAEVEQVLGKLDGEPDGSITDMTGAPSCGYPAADGLLFVGAMPGDVAALQALVEETKDRGAPMEVLEGLGDAAFVAAQNIPGAPNADAVQGLLLVAKGETIMNLALLSNIDEAKTREALQELAQLALARLP